MMAIMVPSPCSIADARNHLPELIRQVERGQPVGITRRGKLVAVVVSQSDYERMGFKPQGFAKALEEFMATRSREGVFSRREVARLRDRSPGRPVRL